MKIHFYTRLVSIFIMLSFSALTQAENHICPSVQSIRDAAQDKNLFQNKGYYHTLKQFGSFDTNETWALSLHAIRAKNTDDAWNSFERYLDKLSTKPSYAEESNYFWDCEYPHIQDDQNRSFWISARLKSPPGPHICPSIRAIRERVNDKSIVQLAELRNGDLSLGTHTIGYLRYFSDYGTEETWILYFEAPWRHTVEGTWEEFQAYLNSLPEIERIAEDSQELDMWQCKYPHTGEDHGYAYATAVLKKR